ncbi:MAG: Hydroxyacylglutathione hydrolase GloC [Hyphomicrobiaceae bacterium hypho_1]
MYLFILLTSNRHYNKKNDTISDFKTQERCMKNQDKFPISMAVIPVTFLKQNCTLLWRTSDMLGTVLDPGGDVDVIIKLVADKGIKVQTIVLTHGHIDHAGGAKELSEKLDVKIEGPHLDDKFLLDTISEKANEYGINYAQNTTPDRWLSEGQICSIAGYDFETLHCPGHSPGSIVYMNHELRFSIVGDVLFKGSVGRTDFSYGSHSKLISNIKTKLLKPEYDDISFICGHGSPSSFGHERKTNPFLI